MSFARFLEGLWFGTEKHHADVKVIEKALQKRCHNISFSHINTITFHCLHFYHN